MPLTFPAHQSVVLPAKLRWPDRLDATALCVAAGAPDLTYPFIQNNGQTLIGALVTAVPLTLLIAAVLRWRAASGVFANLPDLGSWRVHSYRVITKRRPGFAVTLYSATIGVISHVLIDSFTHDDRLISRLLRLDTVLFTLPRINEVTIAWILQMVGHVVGSAAGLWLFWLIGKNRLMEQWYGAPVLRQARTFTVALWERVLFWSLSGGIAGATYLLLADVDTRLVFKVIVGSIIGMLCAGSLVCQDRDRFDVPDGLAADHAGASDGLRCDT